MTPQVWALARLAPAVWPLVARGLGRIAARAAARRRG